MAIDRDRLLNWNFDDVIQSYTQRDVMFYALSIGIGAEPTDGKQLRFVYEKELQVFPSYPLVLGSPGAWTTNPKSGITRSKTVHGEQTIKLHRALPAEGTIRASNRVVEVIDKGEGKGALLYMERKIFDYSTCEHLATLNSTSFCRADGGFGGPATAVPTRHNIPDRAPDMVVERTSVPQAALFYRLNADWNPLHVDPEIAARAGFAQPILHGMCTFAMGVHAVLRSICGYDVDGLKSLSARFTASVFPGEALTFELWRDGDVVSLRAKAKVRGVTVLDHGRAEIAV